MRKDTFYISPDNGTWKVSVYSHAIKKHEIQPERFKTSQQAIYWAQANGYKYKILCGCQHAYHEDNCPVYLESQERAKEQYKKEHPASY